MLKLVRVVMQKRRKLGMLTLELMLLVQKLMMILRLKLQMLLRMMKMTVLRKKLIQEGLQVMSQCHPCQLSYWMISIVQETGEVFANWGSSRSEGELVQITEDAAKHFGPVLHFASNMKLFSLM